MHAFKTELMKTSCICNNKQTNNKKDNSPKLNMGGVGCQFSSFYKHSQDHQTRKEAPFSCENISKLLYTFRNHFNSHYSEIQD